MKTIIELEIETPNTLQVWADADKQEEDYTAEELKEYRDQYCKDLHNHVVGYFQELNKISEEDTFIGDNLLESIDESELVIGEDGSEMDFLKIKVKATLKGTIR